MRPWEADDVDHVDEVDDASRPWLDPGAELRDAGPDELPWK